MNKSEIAERLVAELKAARTAWHESYGVPVSAEYARFMQAIGDLTDFVEFGERAIAESQGPQPKQFDEWWIAVGWSLLGCPAKFSDKYLAAKLTFEAAGKNFGPTPTNCTCNSDSVYCPFHKRDVKPIPSSFELGDGEPSPILYSTTTGHTFPPNPPKVQITFGESGAAQEVSPPSPVTPTHIVVEEKNYGFPIANRQRVTQESGNSESGKQEDGAEEM